MIRFPDFTAFTASSAVVFFRSYSLFQFFILLSYAPASLQMKMYPPPILGAGGGLAFGS